MGDLKNFFCWNKKCIQYGVRGAENIFARVWYGKHKDICLLCCRDCGKKFSERRGTIFSDSRLPKEKTLSDELRTSCHAFTFRRNVSKSAIRSSKH